MLVELKRTKELFALKVLKKDFIIENDELEGYSFYYIIF
jgi:hypothetical protein